MTPTREYGDLGVWVPPASPWLLWPLRVGALLLWCVVALAIVALSLGLGVVAAVWPVRAR